MDWDDEAYRADIKIDLLYALNNVYAQGIAIFDITTQGAFSMYDQTELKSLIREMDGNNECPLSCGDDAEVIRLSSPLTSCTNYMDELEAESHRMNF